MWVQLNNSGVSEMPFQIVNGQDNSLAHPSSLQFLCNFAEYGMSFKNTKNSFGVMQSG